MRNAWTVALMALLACQPAADEATETVAAEPVRFEEATELGDTLTLQTLTPVADILAKPDSFVGQRVLVKGKVTGVCLEKGCWMDIVALEGKDTIQIKVDDGVIVFPSDAVGFDVLAEGTVEKIELTKEQALEEAQHKAEETKTTFDPATITGPVVKYRIHGLGVQLLPPKVPAAPAAAAPAAPAAEAPKP